MEFGRARRTGGRFGPSPVGSNGDGTGHGAQADAVFATTKKLAVDMSGLDYLSSAGIRVLLHLTKTAKAEGKEFALVAPAGMIKVVLAESRMDMFVSIYASADELP